MTKNVLFVFLFCATSCAAPIEKFTTIKDYPPQKEKESEVKQSKPEHDVTFTKLWFIVMNKKRAGDVYSGISTSVANTDGFFKFKLMISVSDQHTKSNSKDKLATPDGLQIIIPEENIAEIDTEHRIKYFILMPSLTFPFARYELPTRFSTPRIEARTGIGYDWYISYLEGGHDVTIFDGKKKKLTLPDGLSDDGYLSSISSIDLDIKPLHCEANLILNSKQIKAALGLGVIW